MNLRDYKQGKDSSSKRNESTKGQGEKTSTSPSKQQNFRGRQDWSNDSRNVSSEHRKKSVIKAQPSENRGSTNARSELAKGDTKSPQQVRPTDIHKDVNSFIIKTSVISSEMKKFRRKKKHDLSKEALEVPFSLLLFVEHLLQRNQLCAVRRQRQKRYLNRSRNGRHSNKLINGVINLITRSARLVEN